MKRPSLPSKDATAEDTMNYLNTLVSGTINSTAKVFAKAIMDKVIRHDTMKQRFVDEASSVSTFLKRRLLGFVA